MRKTSITVGEYYHLYNRGNRKQNIFIERSDYVRFLFLILYFQSPVQINNISYSIANFIKHRVFNNSRNKNKEAEIARKRSVSLVAFTLMPNHFHLLVCERKENGISAYMQRVQNAYAKYYNAKYKTSGHVFQGPYNSVHIEDNEQLLHASAYIHRNQREIKEWKNKEYNYLWSSYHDYARDNRWSELLDQEIILKQFSDKLEYISFVKTSGIKQDYQTLGV